MIRRPPRATRTDTLFPYTTLFRSLGVNGAGKSTIRRIMAGVDKDFVGEAWVAEGATVGYLSQEPDLDPAKDVQGNVIEGLGPLKALMDRFNEEIGRASCRERVCQYV